MSTTTAAQQILGNARMAGTPDVPEKFWELLDGYRAELIAQALAILNNAAEAEDSADAAREHAVARKLIESTMLEVFVLHDQAFGGSKGHREGVFGHRLGVTAAIGCHGHTLREFAERNEVHASDGELDQPRAMQ